MTIDPLIVSKAREVLQAKKQVVVIHGTHQYLKFPVAFHALTEMASTNPGDYLIRMHKKSQADVIVQWDNDVWTSQCVDLLRKKRPLKMDNSKFYLDTLRSEKHFNTLRGAVVYNGALFDKHTDHLRKLLRALGDTGKLLIPTWTDNIDDAWMDAFDPAFVVVHTPDEDYHNRVLGNLGHKSEESYTSPRSVPGLNKPLWQKVLDCIHSVVNVSSGITHPSDRSNAIHLLIKTYQEGERPTSNEVGAYLLKKGWNDRGVKDVNDVWEKILDNPNRSFRIGRFILKPDIMKRIKDGEFD